MNLMLLMMLCARAACCCHRTPLGELSTLPRPPSRLGRGKLLPRPHPFGAAGASNLAPSALNAAPSRAPLPSPMSYGTIIVGTVNTDAVCILVNCILKLKMINRVLERSCNTHSIDKLQVPFHPASCRLVHVLFKPQIGMK